MDEAATKLMELTIPPEPFMRLADTLLDEEEAKIATNAMYNVLEPLCSWQWPSPKCHLSNTQADPNEDSEDRQKHSDEDDEEYTARLGRLDAWPCTKANNDARWIRFALITAEALCYLQRSSAEGNSLKKRNENGRWIYCFDPKKFYVYTWICLNQGFGPRAWKQPPPPMPQDSEKNPGAWYSNMALQTVQNVVRQWNLGNQLDSMFPMLTLNDLSPGLAEAYRRNAMRSS